MAIFSDDPFEAPSSSGPARAGTPKHDIGQPLDSLSIHEIEERITLLRGEIERLQQAARAKAASMAAANSFFK